MGLEMQETSRSATGGLGLETQALCALGHKVSQPVLCLLSFSRHGLKINLLAFPATSLVSETSREDGFPFQVFKPVFSQGVSRILMDFAGDVTSFP